MSYSILPTLTSQVIHNNIDNNNNNINNNNNNSNSNEIVEENNANNNNNNSTPPDYSVYAADNPPPDYITLEDTSCLQQKSIDNVTTQSCHDHISFLYSIHTILERVPQQFRYLYICRAELRYIQWLRLLQREKPSFQSTQNMMIPPMDVMFCWYVHMLSPYRYYDDLIKNNWEYVYNYPLPIEKARDVKTKSYSGKDPISERFWCAFIPSEPYELTLEILQEENERLYACYFCHQTHNSSWEEYCDMRINSQKSILCKHCGSINSCETISCYHFIKDFLSSTRRQVLLKGVMVDCLGKKANLNTTESANLYLMSQLIQEHDQKPIFKESMLNSSEECQWINIYKHLKRLTKRLERFKKGTWDVLLMMTKNCYFNIITPLCIDLIQAIGRQYEFITKLVATDWPKISTLRFAIRRYGMFLHLIKKESMTTSSSSLSSPSSTLTAIPTIDIDVCWHTHMILSSQQYAHYCIHVFGHVLNHNDTNFFDNNNKPLMQCVELTAITWHKYFGSKIIDEPYTGCDSLIHHLFLQPTSSVPLFLGKWVKHKSSGLIKKSIPSSSSSSTTTATATTSTSTSTKTKSITTLDIYLNDELNFIKNNRHNNNDNNNLINQHDTINNNNCNSNLLNNNSNANTIENNHDSNNDSFNSTTVLLSRYEPPPSNTSLLSNKQKHDLFLASMTDIALHNQDSVNKCFGSTIDEQEPSNVGYYGYIGIITGDSLII